MGGLLGSLGGRIGKVGWMGAGVRVKGDSGDGLGRKMGRGRWRRDCVSELLVEGQRGGRLSGHGTFFSEWEMVKMGWRADNRERGI